MTELYEKSLQKLELDRVLAMLAESAVSAEAKERCLKLLPNSDREDVIALQNQTADACRLIDLRSARPSRTCGTCGPAWIGQTGAAA